MKKITVGIICLMLVLYCSCANGNDNIETSESTVAATEASVESTADNTSISSFNVLFKDCWLSSDGNVYSFANDSDVSGSCTIISDLLRCTGVPASYKLYEKDGEVYIDLSVAEADNYKSYLLTGDENGMVLAPVDGVYDTITLSPFNEEAALNALKGLLGGQWSFIEAHKADDTTYYHYEFTLDGSKSDIFFAYDASAIMTGTESSDGSWLLTEFTHSEG